MNLIPYLLNGFWFGFWPVAYGALTNGHTRGVAWVYPVMDIGLQAISEIDRSIWAVCYFPTQNPAIPHTAPNHK